MPSDPAVKAPGYCRVKGAIAARQTGDPSIQFQLNLPDRWNGKAVQFGGSGFNGVVVTGQDGAIHAPGGSPTPLAQGYATFGGDSGHAGQNTDFALNRQALANYNGESVKRTRDAALAIVKSYYSAAPRRTYYLGGSKGGQEGLVAVQRYGADYDGVVAYYPAAQTTAMILSWFRSWEAVYRTPGAWLNPARQALLRKAVLGRCDSLDGAADGLIGNVRGCDQAFDVASLRCAGGADGGDACLSDPQIAALQTARGPMRFAFPMANGITGIGPYPVFDGGDLSGYLYDADGTGIATAYNYLIDPSVRVTFQQNPKAETRGFDYREWRPRIQAISRGYDATSPDLDRFRAHGGKLLIIQGATDMLVPHTMTSAYFERLKARYGARLSPFVRYYVQPGFGHGGGAFALEWDSLAALDRWVEAGEPPSHPIVADGAAATRGRTRPLCEYPGWPRFNGAGDPNKAQNFTCTNE